MRSDTVTHPKTLVFARSIWRFACEMCICIICMWNSRFMRTLRQPWEWTLEAPKCVRIIVSGDAACMVLEDHKKNKLLWMQPLQVKIACCWVIWQSTYNGIVMFSTHDYNCPFVVSTDEKIACDCGHISSTDCCTICDPFKKSELAVDACVWITWATAFPTNCRPNMANPREMTKFKAIRKRATADGRTLTFPPVVHVTLSSLCANWWAPFRLQKDGHCAHYQQ